jgi:intracellular multiplication protein IcmO
MIFSNQDIPGMLNSSPEETKQIFGNTRIKYLMSLEDPNETFEWFAKLAGDITVLVTSNYSKELDMAYRDSLQAQVEKMSRIDFLDVKMQESSEAHIFEGDKLIRAKTFYHGLDGFPVSDVQFSRQLEVKAPTIEQAAQLKAKYMAKRVVNNMIERLEFPDSRASNLKVEVSKNDWIEKLLASPLDTSDGGFAETQEQQELAVEGVEINTAKPKIAASLNPGKIVQQKKNNWVYGFKTSPNLKNEDALSKSLSEVAIAAGVEPNAAKIMAADQAKTVSDSLKYTSVPISADKQDIDDMWDALKALD